MRTFIILVIIVVCFPGYGQVGINTDNTPPNPSAGLDVKSTDKGFLPPRLTTAQVGSIAAPAEGLMVYNTTEKMLLFFNGMEWKKMNGETFWACGFPVIINHAAGNVAPVSKTVSYGTATGIPGENSKCWITRNLGASQQATAKDDATEASAGWYWQFNLKQGYKHDGTTRTPNTSWINYISEDSDWQPGNDPCSIELGTGWRLPTYTEWNNVDVSGGWTDWNGPFNSALKMHTGGYLYYSNGTLWARGIDGRHWSSTQVSTAFGWYIFFYVSGCATGADSKPEGLTLRCIK